MPLTRDNVFNRLLVDHLSQGGTRVSWRLLYIFTDPEPYLFSLQVAHTGAPGANDWTTIAGPTAGVGFLTDPTRRLSGTNPVTHYRVVLGTTLGTYTSEPQSVYGVLGKHQWLNAREVVRGFTLYQRTRQAVPGYLYKRIREGAGQPANEASSPLTAVLDPLTGGIIRRDGDAETQGTGFLGGFYAPYAATVAFEPAAWFEDVDAGLSQGNVDLARTARTGRTLLVPPLAFRDVFVAAGSDLRYEIGKVQVVAAAGDVPLIGDVELRQIPFGDVDYRLTPPPPPASAP